MDRSKYISSDEKKVLDENIKSQVLNLKKNLSDKSKFKLKEEITNVVVMREEGDIDGDE